MCQRRQVSASRPDDLGKQCGKAIPGDLNTYTEQDESYHAQYAMRR
jgi:hypothetical protein